MRALLARDVSILGPLHTVQANIMGDRKYGENIIICNAKNLILKNNCGKIHNLRGKQKLFLSVAVKIFFWYENTSKFKKKVKMDV